MAIVLGLGAASCASQGVPPGGPQDRRPPVVVRTEPDTFALLSDLDAAVRFHFDERISEGQGDELARAVRVSPRTGEVRVDHGRRSLTVRVDGGFRPGLVYRVTLLPAVRDLFGNQLPAPFELVFSTGAEPSPTTLAGEVWDRVQGGGVEDAVVQAVGPDSLVHHAVAGEGGIYALRYLPPGAYELTAFVDRDGDAALDAAEVRGGAGAELGPADTVLVDVPVLAPDTTSASVVRAEPLDSVTVVVELDDYLDPEAPTEEITASLAREGGDAPEVVRLFQEHEYATWVEEVADSLGRLDSITVPRGDTLAPVDSAAAPPGPPERRPPPTLPGVRPPAGGAGGTGGGGRGPLPGRRLVAVLARPLEPGTEYTVTVSGVRNVNGLRGGGGEAELTLPAVVDTTAAPGGRRGGGRGEDGG